MKDIILATDIGGTTCKLGIFNGELEQLHKWSIKTDTSDHTGKTLLKNIYDSFNETLSTHQLKLMMSLALELVYQGLLILKLALLIETVNLHWPGSVNVRQIFSNLLTVLCMLIMMLM